MHRDYLTINNEIALTGFFSEYLPPCFYLNENILKYIPENNCDIIPPYSFSMSRFNGNDARRIIFIPEIGSYLSVYKYMLDNDIIKELVEFTENHHCSFSPILGEDTSIMRHEQSYNFYNDFTSELNTSEYIKNIGKKIIRASGAKKVLKLDISNCFSSFYTHMIPAIILGLDDAQKGYKKKLIDKSLINTYEKYTKLDKMIRQQNLNRTNGLLPGILSSKIIVEALLTRIDIELEKNGFKFVRYVDDYEVYLYDDTEKNAISDFSNILKKYGFYLNYEKVELVNFPYYIVDNFNKILKEKLASEIDSEKMIDVFNSFFEIEKKGTKGAIRFLIKILEKENQSIKILDKELFKAYLISIMANNERSLTKVCSIFINDKDNYRLSKDDVDKIEILLDKHIKYDHDLEVIWLIYLLVETENFYSIDNQLINNIIEKEHFSYYIL